MAKHTDHVVGFSGSIDELTKAIGKMTYDKAFEFLEKLADEFQRQADADSKCGRPQLADHLYKLAKSLYHSRDEMESAWKICKPYMGKDKEH